MPVLNQAQIAERIALYQAYHDAVAKLNGLAAALPEQPPERFVVTWGATPGKFTASEEAEEAEFAPRQRVRFVIQRAWSTLRKAVLADAEKELADAEGAVLAFERGDEVGKIDEPE
ncbi:hypothetical protein GC167_05925 [bacterium]|nr:hypothetical protein [bacterium]